MVKKLVYLVSAALLIPAAVFAQDKGVPGQSGRLRLAFDVERPGFTDDYAGPGAFLRRYGQEKEHTLHNVL